MTWNLETRLELLVGTVTGRQLYAGAAPWLTPPLVRTDVARERLRAWCLGGGLDRPAPTRGDIVDRLAYVGPDEVRVPIVLALELMAPPARDFILDHSQFIGIDSEESGWCGGVVKPRKELQRTILVRRDSEDDRGSWTARRVALHEGAHVWLEANPLDAEDVGLRRQARLEARQSGRSYSALDAPVELRAWNLVEQWEGVPLGGDLWHEIRRALKQ